MKKIKKKIEFSENEVDIIIEVFNLATDIYSKYITKNMDKNKQKNIIEKKCMAFGEIFANFLTLKKQFKS